MLQSSIPYLTIYQTIKYDLFKIDENNNNRDVYQSNIKAIKSCIKQIGDKGGNFPIVVGAVDEDGKAPIIDGQHRFEVRKALKLPIYYIQSLDLSPEDTAFINKAMKKWTIKDFAKLAENKPLMILAKSIISQMPTRLASISALRPIFSFIKSNTKLISITEDSDEYKKMEAQSPMVIMFAKLLEENITDFNSVTFTSISTLIAKLIRKKVLPSDVPKGYYNDVIAELYSKRLIK
jgi:hypothetical protein